MYKWRDQAALILQLDHFMQPAQCVNLPFAPKFSFFNRERNVIDRLFDFVFPMNNGFDRMDEALVSFENFEFLANIVQFDQRHADPSSLRTGTLVVINAHVPEPIGKAE